MNFLQLTKDLNLEHLNPIFIHLGHQNLYYQNVEDKRSSKVNVAEASVWVNEIQCNMIILKKVGLDV